MIEIRPIREEETNWLIAASRVMGGPKMLSNGFLHDLGDYPALIAEEAGEPRGFATYRMGDSSCVVLGILSMVPQGGVGSALIKAVEDLARAHGKSRVRVSATNDNLPAMRFLQGRGYQMQQLFPGAFLEVKKLKGLPVDEPVPGIYGIEIRDEIIFRKQLD